jgi:Archaeal PaREP1/PaREP8 family.
LTSDTAAASVLKFLKRDVAVFMVVELVERPLPKPSSEGYIEARLLEALGETRLALEYLERGLTRNAAGKAFQAWKALLAALLRLELEKLKALAKIEEEKRWLESKAVPRVPTTRMKSLSRLLEEVGHGGISLWTDRVLNLHDYQYNGPDPDMALSKYATRKDAVADIKSVLQKLTRRVEALKSRVRWSDELERALEEVKRALEGGVACVNC